jgi:hypothetical protein
VHLMENIFFQSLGPRLIRFQTNDQSQTKHNNHFTHIRAPRHPSNRNWDPVVEPKKRRKKQIFKRMWRPSFRCNSRRYDSDTETSTKFYLTYEKHKTVLMEGKGANPPVKTGRLGKIREQTFLLSFILPWTDK